uniref:Uncharacterized protein n=1 Tax=Anguilla anguilla TaxID=7936 RepID=A0A0E9RK61_ANGAN
MLNDKISFKLLYGCNVYLNLTQTLTKIVC